MEVFDQESNNTFLVGLGKASQPTTREITEALEKGDLTARAAALETLIRLHLNGESQNGMIMTVIKYITPLEDHHIKKLVLYFWEVVDKTDSEGNLLSVIILICSFLRNDLQHPNEYVRGLTLRFLCKLKEKDLLEPLISAVVQNLSHRVTYVRRNAVLAVHAIYKKFPELLPDALELVENFIRGESDVSARRHAFDMLAACAPAHASRFLVDFREANALSESGEAFLLSVVDFCRKAIRENPLDKVRNVPILFSAMQSQSPAVRFLCASSLLSLSTSPTAIRQATLAFVDILKTHSDNSVRLIVVEQLSEMRGRFLSVLQEFVLDILSAIENGSVEVRERVVELAMELVSTKSVRGFVQAMRRELQRVGSEAGLNDPATAQVYQQRIVSAITTTLVSYPQAAEEVLPSMMDFLCDASGSAGEIVTLIKEVLRILPPLRPATLASLLDLFPIVTAPSVLRSLMWVFGAYAESPAEIHRALQVLRTAVEPFPLTPPEAAAGFRGGAPESALTATPALQAVTTIREDGTYAMTYTSAAPLPLESAAGAAAGEGGGIRSLLIRGDYFLGTTLASTLAKLVNRLFSLDVEVVGATKRNVAQEEAAAILTEVLRYGTSETAASAIDGSSHEHILLALELILRPRAALMEKLEIAPAAPSAVPTAAEDRAAEAPVYLGAIDAPVVFTQLTNAKSTALEMEAVEDGPALVSGTAQGEEGSTEAFMRKLEETVALTGHSDLVFCEASVTVEQFDVVIDWLLINQSDDVLRGVTIELVSHGGIKLCERPQEHTLLPWASRRLRTSSRASTTQASNLHGSIVCETPDGVTHCILLDEILVDIMNYIRPATCHPSTFREKWQTFDWENKIVVETNRHSLGGCIEFLIQELNMRPLEEPVEDSGTAPFDCVSSNLYARTVFGEDALVNASLEKDDSDCVSGVIRIRSKTQGIAYGIGERLNALRKMGRC